MINKAEIGKRIKDARRRKKMTLKELENKSGISASTISRIEKGKGMNIDHLEFLSEALDIDIKSLLGFDDVSDNVDDFINLFCKIIYSEYNKDTLAIEDAITPTKLVTFSEDRPLILYMNDRLYTLFKDVARAYTKYENINDTEMKEQAYKEYLQTAKNKYKKVKKRGARINVAHPYLLLSRKQLIEIISKVAEHPSFYKKHLKTLHFRKN